MPVPEVSAMLLCSPLDVHPDPWAHLPGFEEELAHRRKKLAAIKVHPQSRHQCSSCVLFNFIAHFHL